MSYHPRSRRPADYGAALWIACFSPQADPEPTILPALTDAEQPLPQVPPNPMEALPPLPLHKRIAWRPLCA